MKVKIQSIKVEKKNDLTKRHRRDFGDILKLAESIEEHGLMHPIVVDKDPSGENEYILIAGERRIRACIFNGWSDIPVTVFSEMDDLDRKICELEENTMREDLSWQEQVEAVRQLDALKREKYGDAVTNQHDDKKGGWRLKDTADMIGVSKGTVSQDINLARQLQDRPDLRKKVAKLPKHAARKIINQTLEEEMLKRHVESKKIKLSASLKHGDCTVLIDDLRDESIDLWLTDPPFGDANIVKVSGADSPSKGMPLYNMTTTNVGTDVDMADVYRKLLPKVFNKLKPGAHIYVFFAHSWYCRLTHMLRETGFIIDDQPIVWDKCRVSVMAKDLHYMSSYEAILFGYKPPAGRILTKPVANVLSYPALPHQRKTHPLQRPYDLLKILIENSSSIGQTVLDTFAGSASTIVAARRLQRNAVGFEIDEGNFLRAQEWINKEIKE